MSAFTAFKEGVRTVNRNVKMCFLFLIFNALFALVLVLPVFSLMSNTLSHGLYAEGMFKEFDVQWIAEFLYKYQGLPIAMMPLLISAAVVYLIFNTFLVGGALDLFNSEDRTFSLSRFLSGCGNYFPRLFRLLLLSIPLYAVVLGINIGLSGLFDKLLENSIVERPVAFLAWFRTSLVLFLLCLVNMTFDYAKIKSVVDESKKAMSATSRSMKFIAKNLRPTLGLYFFIVLLSVSLLVAYSILEGVLPQNSVPLLLVVFLLQQTFILSKVWIRLTFFSSQMALYKGFRLTTSPSMKVSPALPEAVAEPIIVQPVKATEAVASEAMAAGEKQNDSIDEYKKPT